MKRSALALLLLCSVAASAQSFTVTFPKERSAQPLDGRLLLLLSTDPSDEPRNQINDTPRSQIVFGITVDGWKPGQPMTVDATAWGYPMHSLNDLPPGEYYVQARAQQVRDLSSQRWQGHQAAHGPGRRPALEHLTRQLYSKLQKIIVKHDGAPIALSLTEEIPPIPEPVDTKYIRHIRIQSAVLTKFWGRPMFLGAAVLVPEGFDEHPDSHFPLIIFHDHFVPDFDDFRTTPPDPNLKPDYSERFHLAGYNRIQQQEAYKFYQQWISPKFPRVLIVKIQHANPYYDDSYAVDSANVGPYGEAIETELIPAIEKRFRGLGQGWARFVYGGSTGGWEALAVQVFYPDHYNGAFAACPDPIDFHAFTNIDLYNDKNAFFLEGAHKRVPQPAMRDYLGHTLITTEDNQWLRACPRRPRPQRRTVRHLAGGLRAGRARWLSRSRSSTKSTGDIDHTVANYWRDHYDLEAILQRDWAKLGPELPARSTSMSAPTTLTFSTTPSIACRTFSNTTTNPPYGGEVTYGPRAEHCWNGDPTLPNAYSRLHYNTQYLPKILERIEKTAPAGADLTSWRY